MRSRARLLLALPALVAAQSPEQTLSTTGKPSATAGDGAATAYDRVGHACVDSGEAMTATHAGLPIGSIAEITALDSGSNILVQVTGRPSASQAGEITLSAAAARALSLREGVAAVRVRSVRASAADLAALRKGDSASPRLPAPEALLRGLRRQLTMSVSAIATPAQPRLGRKTRDPRSVPSKPVVPAPIAPIPVSSAPASSTPVSSVPAPRGGLLVQVAALRDASRARALARALHGRVEPAAGLWRVRLGPFADRAAAQRARDAAISRGYGDASIISAP